MRRSVDLYEGSNKERAEQAMRILDKKGVSYRILGIGESGFREDLGCPVVVEGRARSWGVEAIRRNFGSDLDFCSPCDLKDKEGVCSHGRGYQENTVLDKSCEKAERKGSPMILNDGCAVIGKMSFRVYEGMLTSI